MNNGIDPYRNAWNLMKQMVDEYSKEKKYLTSREIKYIIRTCERGIDVYAAFNPDFTTQGEDVVVDLKENNDIADSDDDSLENLFFHATGRRNDKFVSMLRGKFDPKDIKSKLEFFGEYIKTHEVKSPEGFIFDALRRDYEPNLPVVKKNKVKCKRCDGDGYFVDKNTGEVCFCPDCGGKGLILPESEYT